MGIELEQLMQSLSDTQKDVRARLREIWRHNQETSVEVRRVSHHLHPSKLEYLGLVAAVQSFCEERSGHGGVKIRFKHTDIPSQIPGDVALCMYRVIQEALHNATKHSGAKDVQVIISGSQDTLELCVKDDGVGFDPDSQTAKKGIGLIGMRERLLLVDGELSIKSKRLSGTSIIARIPLKAKALYANDGTRPATPGSHRSGRRDGNGPKAARRGKTVKR
jgi:signal transduction histidine kinase